jgi:hypothetical protein
MSKVTTAIVKGPVKQQKPTVLTPEHKAAIVKGEASLKASRAQRERSLSGAEDAN